MLKVDLFNVQRSHVSRLNFSLWLVEREEL